MNRVLALFYVCTVCTYEQMDAAPLTKDFGQECVLVFFGTCYSLDAYCVHKHRPSSHEHTLCTFYFIFFEAVKKMALHNNY